MKTAKFKKRVSALQKKLRETSTDALLIRNGSNIFYLCGYARGDAYAIIPASGKGQLLVDFIYEEEALKTCLTLQVVRVQKSFPASVAEVIGKLDAKTVGFEAGHMYYTAFESMRRAIGAKRKLKPTQNLVENLRMVKDEDEIGDITKAIRVLEKGLLFFKELSKTGLEERVILKEFENHLARLGVNQMSFETIVAAGANASQPHAQAAKTRAAKNKGLLIDAGTRVNNYCSDLTRTFILNNISTEFGRIYEIVLKAQKEAIKTIAPGVKIEDVDSAARNVISSQGLGEFFGHSLGHGVGIDIHEEPRISQGNANTLVPGTVFTVEPGIYIPGRLGIRIEDMVVVTENGCKVLSRFPKTINSMLTY